MIPKIKLPPLPRETYEGRMRGWFRMVALRESGVVLFPTRLDRARRLTQFLRDTVLQEKIIPHLKDTQIVPISTEFIHKIEDVSGVIHHFQLDEGINQKDVSLDLDELFLRKYRHKQFVLVVTDAETIYLENKLSILKILNDLDYQYRNISVIQLVELNLLHPQFFPFIKNYSALFNNIIYAPLYEKDDAFHFLDYLVEYFEMPEGKLNLRLKNYLYDHCGGHLWLLKEAVRFLKNNPDASPEELVCHAEMDLEMKIIWESMLLSEKSVLKKIITRNYSFNQDEKPSLEYLLKQKIIEKTKSGFRFTQKLLSEHVEKELSENFLFVSDESEIYVNSVNIDELFSDKEKKLLTILMSHRNQTVSRDILGQEIWGEEKGFTDWSLDRLVSRVRKKLAKVGCGPKAIKTILGKGYRVE